MNRIISKKQPYVRFIYLVHTAYMRDKHGYLIMCLGDPDQSGEGKEDLYQKIKLDNQTNKFIRNPYGLNNYW